MAVNNPVDFEVIQRLYDQGQSVVNIAAKFGVTKQAVYERMRRNGVAYRSREPQQPTISKEVLETLYAEERLTIAEIARRLGRSWDSVESALNFFGIERTNNRAKPPRPDVASLRIGDQLEIETDGTHPYFVYGEARKLNIRLVIRRVSERRFAIIKTPLLTAERVKAFRKVGMSITDIAFIYRACEKTIRRLL